MEGFQKINIRIGEEVDELQKELKLVNQFAVSKFEDTRSMIEIQNDKLRYLATRDMLKDTEIMHKL